MKILHVCLAAFFPDNYAYQENLLPKYHKKLGYEVEVLASLQTFDENGKIIYLSKPSQYVNEYEIKVTRLQNRKPFKLMRRLRIYNGTMSAIEKSNPDIFFIHNGSFLDILKIRKYVRKHPEKKIYIDNHGDYINSARNWLSLHVLHKGLWRLCFKLIEPYTTKFYGVLPIRVDFLKDVYGTPPNKTELLVMGADDEKVSEARSKENIELIKKKLGLDEKDFVIISGGKIDYNKPQIIELMEIVHGINNPHVKLIVFGNVIPEYKEKVHSLSYGNVIFIGWINSQDVYKYYSASDLGVFTGKHSVLWEQAVGCGLPLLVKEWDGMKHIDLGGNVVFISDNSPATVKKALISIVETPEIIGRMKDVAESKGMKLFSYKDIAKRSIEEGFNE